MLIRTYCDQFKILPVQIWPNLFYKSYFGHSSVRIANILGTRQFILRPFRRSSVNISTNLRFSQFIYDPNMYPIAMLAQVFFISPGLSRGSPHFFLAVRRIPCSTVAGVVILTFRRIRRCKCYSVPCFLQLETNNIEASSHMAFAAAGAEHRSIGRDVPKESTCSPLDAFQKRLAACRHTSE